MSFLNNQQRQAQGRQSWVYVIDNPSMPGMIKVGYTTRHPKARLKDRDYSVSTGMPTPYRIAFAVGVRGDQARRVEHAVHQQLPGRVTQPGVKGNEWFRCQATQAISIITKTAAEQQQQIEKYYNPRGMDISHLPPLPPSPATKARPPVRTRDETCALLARAMFAWGMVAAAALLVGWLAWEPTAALLAWLGWEPVAATLAWLWEVLTWLAWLAWVVLAWLAWLVWEVLTWLVWLVWEVLTWLWEALT